MFGGKPYEKLSRSTQYRIRKILFKSDDEVEDCSNRGSNVSRETDGSDTNSVCPGFDYLKSTDDDSDCCETINGCCDDYDNDEQDDNFMDCSDYTEETESISPDNNEETESIGPDNNEDTESVSSDKNNFEEWNESQSNASGSDSDESDVSTNDSSFYNENLNSPLYPNSPLTLVYDSELYKRKRKTNSSIVVYNHNNRNYIGVISEFLKVCSCQNIPCDVNCITSNVFAIITKCLSIKSIIPNALIDMVDLCVKSDQLQLAININNLITVCFSIDNDNDYNYINFV
ncbi:protein PFC0760c-like [Cotesia glomerata]|uniref:protein PFC0760c-like n=1 Tax=Cotesia glomerata TaxID=32391 RepID=UPI001D004305|nr:protein PFC0760c-like [Cotesia glomerata]